MPTITDLPDHYTVTRSELQRIATHVLARARAAHGGHVGLRRHPDGHRHASLRARRDGGPGLAGTDLVVEHQADDGVHRTHPGPARRHRWPRPRPSLERTSAGRSPPARMRPRSGDPDAPLTLDPVSVGHRPRLVPHRAPGCSTPCSPTSTDRAPRSCGPSTSTSDSRPRPRPAGSTSARHPATWACPSLISTWRPGPTARPGDPDYWNAPYGAVATRSALRAGGDPVTAGIAFVTRGLTLLAAA